MKKVVILHGTDGNPDINWLPWLKDLLESNGVEVWVPQLPDCHTPNRFKYDEFLKSSGWDFGGNLVVGHSSGATAVLNLLQSDWLPKVDTAILVGTFLNEKLTKDADWYELGQFDELFPEKFDVEKIKGKADNFYFIHGDNDLYCDFDDAKEFCQKLDGNFTAVKNGQHLSSNRTKLPEIVSLLKDRGYL